MRTTGRLIHGGIMANYRCTAACRHCLYACGPDRTGGYITSETARAVCALLRKGGCPSVHIGGGEPFLDFEGLLSLVSAVNAAGIGLDYIETNACWAQDERKTRGRLRALLDLGVDTLCISVDPFHAEYVPVERPISLAKACERAGMGYFLWKQQYLRALAGLAPDKAHSRGELEKRLSPTYIAETAGGYGLRYGGRAVNIEEEFCPRRPVAELLGGGPCRELLSTSHFHVDLHGRFIPPGCTGVSVPLAEAVEGIPDGKYPALEALLAGGVGALYDHAAALGFAGNPAGYTSRCALCFHLRRWLSRGGGHPELDAEHYEASLAHY